MSTITTFSVPIPALTQANQQVSVIVRDCAQVTTLRSLFQHVVVTKIELSIGMNLSSQQQIVWGVVPSSRSLFSTGAEALACPNLRYGITSQYNFAVVSEVFMPPGVEFDLAQASLFAGHPVIRLARAVDVPHGATNATVAAGMAYITVECTGQAFGI